MTKKYKPFKIQDKDQDVPWRTLYERGYKQEDMLENFSRQLQQTLFPGPWLTVSFKKEECQNVMGDLTFLNFEEQTG